MTKQLCALTLGAFCASSWWAVAMFGQGFIQGMSAGFSTLFVGIWIVFETITSWDA